MESWLTLTLISTAVGLIYLFLVSNFGYWKKRGVREAQSYPLFGSFPSTFTHKRHMVYDVDEIYTKFKNKEKFVGVYSCRTPQLLILDPEYVHKIYVNNFESFHDNEFSQFVDEKYDLIMAKNPFCSTGQKWKDRRSEIVRGMNPNWIKNTYAVTMEVCKRFEEFINHQITMASKDGIEANELCLRFTSEVVTDCVLDLKAKSLTDKPTPIPGMIQKLFQFTKLFAVYELVARLFPAVRRFYKMRYFPKYVERFFIKLMEQVISLRHIKSTAWVDFIYYMIEMQKKKRLSNTDLISHVMTFLTDGFITTASAIAHCLLLLARDPNRQKLLYDEILQNIDESGNLSYDKLNELPYLDACLHEALRLFAPMPVINKICTAPFEFVNTNGEALQIEIGDVVVIPTYSLHHDEHIYEQPEEFRPERFLLGNGSVKKYRELGIYNAFGDGPRICLGMAFALSQSKAAIVGIIKNFNIKPNPKTRIDNCLDTLSFIATLDGGIWLDIERRN